MLSAPHITDFGGRNPGACRSGAKSIDTDRLVRNVTGPTVALITVLILVRTESGAVTLARESFSAVGALNKI